MQVADRRTLFERSLRRVTCPKCYSKILEVDMPNVICIKCSTKYILAVGTKGFLLHQLDYKLIEQKNEARELTKEKEIIKEKEVIVKVRCSYCHGLHNETDNYCPFCNAKV